MKPIKSFIILIFLGLSLCMSAQDASFYKKYADKGDKEAMYNLAQCYINGTGGVEQDLSTATLWLTKSAKKNYAPAQHTLAICYLNGAGVMKDYKKAWELFNNAAKNGNTNSLFWIGWMYKDGIFVPANKTLALKYIREAAQKGDKPAMGYLGKSYLFGESDLDIKQDVYSAVRYLKSAAEGDDADADATYNLGLCYKYGAGTISKDPEKAFETFYKAGQLGSNQGCYEVGLAFLLGNGTEVNVTEAVKLINYAAQQGVVDAYKTMGDLYYYGLGVEEDNNLAFQWYQKAVDDGNTSALPQLANMTLYGVGTTANEYKGFQLYKKAADAEEASGYGGLGMCYERGIGTSKNIQSAISNYKKGAELGNNYSRHRLYYIYTDGENGVSVNPSLAIQYLREAADDDYNPALYSLAYEYASGDNMHAEPSKAIEYFTKAAEGGYTLAAAVLGTLYYSGDYLVSKNYDKAFEYLKQAVEDPSAISDELLAQVYRDLGACYRFGRGTTANQSMASYYTEQAAKYGDTESLDAVKLLRKDN